LHARWRARSNKCPCYRTLPKALANIIRSINPKIPSNILYPFCCCYNPNFSISRLISTSVSARFKCHAASRVSGFLSIARASSSLLSRLFTCEDILSDAVYITPR
jgi:hypothetical protein